MSVNAIRKAIYEAFTDDDLSELYMNTSGRMYFYEAPEETDRPYCIFKLFDQNYDFTFDQDIEFEEVMIQFEYYSTTAEDCDDGISYILTMYDFADLDITGYTCLRMERQTVLHPERIEPEGEWVGIVSYSLLVQEE